MALTPYLGLTYFGGDVPGSLTDDGAAFTGADRLLLDRVVHALAVAGRHLEPAAVDLNPDLPTAAVTADGQLPGGESYAYVVTLVDANGVESTPSPAVTVSTPAVLDTPLAPDVAADAGGTLPAGLYYYAVTALRAGEESALGDLVTMTLIPGEGTVTLTMPAAPTGTTSWQVWRQSTDDGQWRRVAVVPVATSTFTDDGSDVADSATPPDSNAGTNAYAATITLAATDVAALSSGLAVAWRLYRTETPDAYPAVSLVHHVTETTTDDPASPVMTSWTDDGDALLTGAPPQTAARLALTPYVLDSAATAPDPAGYPEFYPLLIAGVLHARIGGTWVALGGSGGATSSPVITGSDGTRYRLVVDGTGTLSAQFTLEPDGPPAPPAVVVAGATVSWTAVPGADTYLVYDQLTTTTSTAVSGTSYTCVGDGSHFVQVFAVNGHGSTPAAAVTVTVSTGGGGGGIT